MSDVRSALIDELDPPTLYALLRLRVDVFVVEQQCPYPELDGRDLEPTTVHVWLADDAGLPQSYLRVLTQPDGHLHIGRVVTAPAARGQGLGDRLMRHALRIAGEEPVVLEAQAQLEGWYGRFGFVRAGDTYVEDGIPHVPMRLAGR